MLFLSSFGILLVILWLVLTERASHSPTRWIVSLFLPILVAVYGLRRRSLDRAGAALAVLVGALLTLASACFCSSLIAFFITSSRLTKWRKNEKLTFEADAEGYNGWYIYIYIILIIKQQFRVCI